jgi:hypothetical protein
MSGGTSCDSETAGLCFVNDDTVTYAGRLNRVRADADIAAADDGEAGEGDTIIADVERIVGGNGNNVLGGITTNFFHFSGLRRLVGMRFEGRAGNDVCEARELRIRSWEERATTSSTAVAGPTRFRAGYGTTAFVEVRVGTGWEEARVRIGFLPATTSAIE